MRSRLQDERREPLMGLRSEMQVGERVDSECSRRLVTASIFLTRGVYASRRRRRRRRFTDGPFTETKELIGSFSPPNAARR